MSEGQFPAGYKVLLYGWGYIVPLCACMGIYMIFWGYSFLVYFWGHRFLRVTFWRSFSVRHSLSEGHFLHCQHFWVQFWNGLSTCHWLHTITISICVHCTTQTGNWNMFPYWGGRGGFTHVFGLCDNSSIYGDTKRTLGDSYSSTVQYSTVTDLIIY